jgi:hypothetical protein
MGKIKLPDLSPYEIEGMIKYGINTDSPSITAHCFRLGYLHAKQEPNDTKQALLDAGTEIAILKDRMRRLKKEVRNAVDSVEEKEYWNCGMGFSVYSELKHPSTIKAEILKKLEELLDETK